MSNEVTDKPGKRPYRQKARARHREDIHRRITLAAVYLHGSIGPARTTVSDIAKRAGVRRATVYNHFPTDLELIDSCSTHWFGENPPPNPAEWAAISDPAQRTRVALEAMYKYYDHGQEMLENVFRDTPQVPALQEILRLKWWPLIEMMIEMLSPKRSGSPSDAGTSAGAVEGDQSISPDENLETRASLRVALDFFTWQTLTASGLSSQKAAQLAAGWIERGWRSPR